MLQPLQDPYTIITRGYGENNNRIVTRGYAGWFMIIRREIIRLESTITQLRLLARAFFNKEVQSESSIIMMLIKIVREFIISLPFIAKSDITQDVEKKSFITRIITLKNRIRK